MSRSIATTVTLIAVAAILLTATMAGGASSPGQAPPTNLTPPSISGTPQQGQPLTASTGTWSGKSLSYSFQWLRCDSTGAGCSAITGATSSTDVLSSADVGHTLRIMVTASNRNGSSAATSAATGVIAAATSAAVPPSNASLPTLSGVDQQGQTLTAGTGSWSGTTPMTYAYQWARCNSSGGSCVPVSGATASSYLLGAADVGSEMRVSVTASNSAGSATASVWTGVIAATTSAAVPPTNTSLPALTGTAQQGQTLNATTGSWSGTTPMTYAYQWSRCNSSGGSCVPVSGATASSYLLGAGDVGSEMRVSVTASNSAGSATANVWTGVVTATSTSGTGSDTSMIDDEGTIRMGSQPTAMTNGDKFATFAFGGYYNIFQPLPGRKVKYVSGIQCTDGDDVVASKSTCRANGWLIHNSSGQEIAYFSGGDGLLTNVGNVNFQNDLKQRILNFLAAHPWLNGVYFDNGATSMNQYPTTYPIYDQNNNLLWSNDSDFQKAQISFMANVAAALKAKGYVVGYNAKGLLDNAGCAAVGLPSSCSDNGSLSKWWMDQYAPYVTAAMIEYWHQSYAACCGSHLVDLSGGAVWYNHWDEWQNVEAYAQSKGLEFWPADYIGKTELSQCRYLRGSYLLDWNGKGSMMFMSWDGSDFWNSCTATDVGFPSGAKYQPVAGVWERQYTRGYVIVNPTASTVVVGSDTVPSGDAILHQN